MNQTRPAPLFALVLSMLMSVAFPASAQAVWRCGADGRQFTDKPCEQGQALEALEPRPAADLAAAHSVARREQALAAQLQRERQQRETQAPQAAAGIRAPRAEEVVKPKAKAPRRGRHPHPADDGIWRATAPSSRQTKG